MFNRRRRRHEPWMKKYPNREDATRGPTLSGIANVREETKKTFTAPVQREDLPLDPREIPKR